MPPRLVDRRRSPFDVLDPLKGVQSDICAVLGGRQVALIHSALTFRRLSEDPSLRMRLARLPGFIAAITSLVRVDEAKPPETSSSAATPSSTLDHQNSVVSSTQKCCLHALFTIRNLLLHERDVDIAMINAEGFLDSMARLLLGENIEFQALAAAIVDDCTADPEFRSFMCGAEGITDGLVRSILRNPAIEALSHAVHALSVLASYPIHNTFVLARTRLLVPTIIQCVSSSPNENVRDAALLVLYWLSRLKENHGILAREPDCVSTLLELLDSDKRPTRDKAKAVLLALSANPRCLPEGLPNGSPAADFASAES